MTGEPAPPRHVLTMVVLAQFSAGSLWFAGNAVLPGLVAERGLPDGVGAVTSAVQLGFIAGTALLAVTGLADRVPARAIFLASATSGSALNLGLLGVATTPELVGVRFGVGLCLAGIYPIGMKLAASWTRGGLGTALGFLVGALVLGTAFPHLLGSALPWRATVVGVSALALFGGAALFTTVAEGPCTRRAPFDPAAIPRLARLPAFRAAALGYFGHMWELYTLWAFVPLLVERANLPRGPASFVVIASGALGCVGGGLLAPRVGSARVAAAFLAISGACCLLLPWALALPAGALLAFLVVWGIAVVGDSPQYSALTALAAPAELVGTGLTLVTALGFGLTVASIELAVAIGDPAVAFPLVALGPAAGLYGLRALVVGEPVRA